MGKSDSLTSDKVGLLEKYGYREIFLCRLLCSRASLSPVGSHSRATLSEKSHNGEHLTLQQRFMMTVLNILLRGPNTVISALEIFY